MNNGAASPFGQAAAFGNFRRGPRSLYTGGIGWIVDHSALDARPFSLTGQDTPKPAFSHVMGVASFGGPLKIPHILPRNGPNVFVNYQWLRNRSATTQPGLMPDAQQRAGVFTAPVIDPQTGAPFPGNVIPQSRISPQATALLGLYPLPNFQPGGRYNYQVPLVAITHQDSLQSRWNKTAGHTNQLSGSFAFQSVRTDNPSIFGFDDTGSILGINTAVNWMHRYTQRIFQNINYHYSRQAARTTPFFANRENVSGEAGITGNNQEPVNWGPPALSFASGIAGLDDAQRSVTRNQTSGLSYSILWVKNSHSLTFGGDFRRQEFNLLSQQDPRGTFTFTGAATGSDFAGFLLGIPDTSAIAFGNPDKYFRASSYDAYFTDDWRVGPGLTLNAGMRWEYNSPITERYGRLVNLDLAGGFAAAAPVVAGSPTGPLTGARYPDSLVQPDKHGFEPRIGFAWHPLLASSLVVRGGYGVYYDSSVYFTIAAQMAQQSPLSKSLSVANSAANPLTLANGFYAPPSATTNTFAIDPNFRVGYSQNWQLSVQRDLPGGAGGDRHVPGDQGNAGAPAVSAEHLAGRRRQSLPHVPGGVYLRDFERELDARIRPVPVAAQAPQRIHRQPAIHIRQGDRRCRPGRHGPGRPGDRAGLARPQCGARAFPIRPAAPAERHAAVQHRRRTRRRDAAGRLERCSLQGLDVHDADQRRLGTAADSYLSVGRERYRCHRKHPAGLHRCGNLRCAAGAASSIRRPWRRPPPVNGETPGGIRSPGRRNSA